MESHAPAAPSKMLTDLHSIAQPVDRPCFDSVVLGRLEQWGPRSARPALPLLAGTEAFANMQARAAHSAHGPAEAYALVCYFGRDVA